MRLFVGVMLPAELGRKLAELARHGLGAAAESPALRLVPSESMHLTLAFLGEVESARVPHLSGCLRAVFGGLDRPSLALGGTGSFPRRGAERVLWFALRDLGSGALDDLWHTTSQALDSSGFRRVHPEQGFVPHLTVARILRGPGLPRILVPKEFYELSLEGPWRPKRVSLLESRSRQGRGQPSYELVEAFELGGRVPDSGH